MKYLVIEIQVSDSGAVGNFVWSFGDINAAYSQYHTVLASAAVSNIPIHSAVIMNETGFCIKHESFDHRQPEPPEPEIEG